MRPDPNDAKNKNTRQKLTAAVTETAKVRGGREVEGTGWQGDFNL